MGLEPLLSYREFGLDRIQAVILAGGKGMRLREETENKPKPMVEIGPRPILCHIMKCFQRHGVERFVVCLGYKGEVIKRFFLEYDAMSSDLLVELGRKAYRALEEHDERWEILLTDTGPETGTGGRIKRVERYVEGDYFFATYGDGLGDVDLESLLDFHVRGGWVATLTAVRPRGRFGHLTVDDDRVLSFVEKPNEIDGWVNGGFFVFRRDIFDYLDYESHLEQAPLEHLAQEGKLGMFPHEGYWACMDTYRDYEELQREWASGKLGWLDK